MAPRVSASRNRAAAHLEHESPAREDVGHGEVLGQSERVPLGDDVEHLAETEPPGDPGKVHAKKDQVGRDLIAFVLEVVLGQPEGVEPRPVSLLGPMLEVDITGDHVIVRGSAVGRDGCSRAGVWHGHGGVEVEIGPQHDLIFRPGGVSNE